VLEAVVAVAAVVLVVVSVVAVATAAAAHTAGGAVVAGSEPGRGLGLAGGQWMLVPVVDFKLVVSNLRDCWHRGRADQLVGLAYGRKRVRVLRCARGRGHS